MKNAGALPLQALADVDTGNVVDHKSAQAWAQSLRKGKLIPPPAAAKRVRS